MDALRDRHLGDRSRLFEHIDPYLLFAILLSVYIPLIGVHLYFRHDDAGTLLWAMEFKKNFLHAFDPRPWFNEYNVYNGVGGYYRPFESIYIMILVRIFGPDPVYFQLLNGIMVIATLVFMYKIVAFLSSRQAGLLSVIIFHLAFQSLLYGTYHVVVPFGFFFEMITFYLFIKGLYENKLKTVLIGFLCLIPATNRQTSALILTAMVILFFITHWRESKFQFKTRLLILLLAVFPNLLILFTSNSSNATILNQPFNLLGYMSFAWERLFFYSNILTRGLTGLIILTIFSIFWLMNVPYQKIFPAISKKVILLSVLPLGLVISFLFLKLQLVGIIFLFATVVVLFFKNKKIRLPIAWFLVSLSLFSIIYFYHDAYLLEASFAVAIILGILLFNYLEAIQKAFSIQASRRIERFTLATGAFLILGFGAVIWQIPSLPVVGKKIDAVKILIETNQNFREMFEYLARELPPNAKVFQLSDEYLGLDMNARRFLPLRERAENVKVIDILDSNVMIKVLGRYDIEFKHAEGLTLGIPENCVFIVHNKLEKKVAERKFDLEPIKRFVNQNTEAMVYKVLGIKEDLFLKE